MIEIKNNWFIMCRPDSAIGKSFVSVKVVAALTIIDKRVLLIAGDAYLGHLHRYSDPRWENDLSDFTGGETPIGQSLRRLTILGLTFISKSKILPNFAQLLLDQRFSKWLSALTPRCDRIIIVSTLILAVIHTSIIGQLVGATMVDL